MSSLVYTEDMNQASLSVAGAYGVSGVQKLTAAATGYCGRSTGENAKTTSVVLEVLIRAGFETVLLNNMSPPELLEALALGPRHSAKKALDASDALMTKLRATKTGLLETLSKPEARNGKTISKLYGEWLQAADQFRANYGEGMIVGIVWGASAGPN